MYNKLNFYKNLHPKEEENLLPEKFFNQVINGDSEEILKELPSSCIDVIITSPPYNFNIEYDVYRDDKLWDEYFDKLFRIFDECIRVLKYSGRFIINIKPSLSNNVPTHHIISNYLINKGLIWKVEILWEKNQYNGKYTAWGSWKSPSCTYFRETWEYIEVYCKGSLLMKNKKENIDLTEEEFKNWIYAKWEIEPNKIRKYKHHSMFPIELVKRLIKMFSYKGNIILDPFNGVGTTTYVAKLLSRNFLGIDLSSNYCEIARKRLNDIDNMLL